MKIWGVPIPCQSVVGCGWHASMEDHIVSWNDSCMVSRTSTLRSCSTAAASARRICSRTSSNAGGGNRVDKILKIRVEIWHSSELNKRHAKPICLIGSVDQQNLRVACPHFFTPREREEKTTKPLSDVLGTVSKRGVCVMPRCWNSCRSAWVGVYGPSCPRRSRTLSLYTSLRTRRWSGALRRIWVVISQGLIGWRERFRISFLVSSFIFRWTGWREKGGDCVRDHGSLTTKGPHPFSQRRRRGILFCDCCSSEYHLTVLMPSTTITLKVNFT